MRRFAVAIPIFAAFIVGASGPIATERLSIGDKEFSAMFKGSPIVARTTTRLGGAIYSVTWNGREFINSSDHGRELQSASSFDGYGEAYNPPEAGASRDSRHSTSVVLSLSVEGNVLEGETQMAFWEGGLSSHVLKRKITIGYAGIPNVIQHLVTFAVPEAHQTATFEALTGYMPPEFSKFYAYFPVRKLLKELPEVYVEQRQPVILSTADGRFAMGTYSPHPAVLRGGAYGRWRFPREQVVKWNCVYRRKDIVPGDYTTECYSIIGTLADVTEAMSRLHRHFNPLKKPAPQVACGGPSVCPRDGG